jgi:predicted membrane protein
MESRVPPQFRVTPQFILGLLVVLFGLSLTADNLQLIEADRLWRYWPLLIVAAGLAKFLQAETPSAHVFGGGLMLLGGLLGANTIWNIGVNVWDFFPLVFVALGVTIILRAWRGRAMTASTLAADPLAPRSEAHTRPERAMSEFAFWSGIQRRVSSAAFRRADLTAIMGGIELDLRQAGTAGGEAVIDVFVWWGGIEITVPPDWAVSNQVFALMGGADDASSGGQDARHHLIVRGFVVMGGVEIKTS